MQEKQHAESQMLNSERGIAGTMSFFWKKRSSVIALLEIDG